MGFPGLIVDRYADALVVQLLSAGASTGAILLIGIVQEQSGCARVYERSDTEARDNSKVSPRAAAGSRAATSGRPGAHPRDTAFNTSGCRRAARRPVSFSTSATIAPASATSRAGREILNCFCYTGGFTLAALAGGASSVLSIDSPRTEALELARVAISR